jgi:hypothetical protein
MPGLLSSQLYGSTSGRVESRGLLSSILSTDDEEQRRREQDHPILSKVEGAADWFLNKVGVNTDPNEGARVNAVKQTRHEQDAQQFPTDHPDLAGAMEKIDKKGAQGLGWVFKQLSRGRDAGTKMIDATATNTADAIAYEQGPVRQAVALMTTLPRSVYAAGREGILQEEQISAADLIRRGMPEWAGSHPAMAEVLGFAGDVVVDPTTYLTLGSANAVRPAKVSVGLDRKALQELTIEAGVNPSAIDRLASLAGKNPQAERALAFESKAAVDRAYLAQRQKIVGEYQGFGSAATGTAQGAAEEVGRAQKALDKFDRYAAKNPLRSPEKKVAREQARTVLEGKITSAQRRLEYSERVAGEVAQGQPAALDTMSQKLMELELAHKELQGKVFSSGDELQTEFGKLLGTQPSVEVVWDGPGERMARLLEDTHVQAALKDEGGIKFAGKSVVSGSALDRAAEITGFNRVLEARDKFKHFLNEIAPMFRSRNAPITEELQQLTKMPDGTMKPLGEAYVEARSMMESLTDAADNISFRDQTERFFSLKKDSREKLGKMMWELDDLARGQGLGEGLGDAEKIAAAQERIKAANLTADEDKAFRHYYSTMQQAGQVEKEMGLLTHLNENYYAKYYRPNTAMAARDSAMAQERELADLNRSYFSAQVPGGKLGAGKSRVFPSLDVAQEAGFEPVYDMVASYTLRMTQHRRAIAREQFKDTLFHLFPGAREIPDASGKGVKLIGVPKEVARDLRYMGDGIYPPDAWGMSSLFRKYDKAMSYWRRAATVVKPNFGVRQGVSNTVQMSLALGMGALDPRAHLEAFSLMAGKGEGMQIRTMLGEQVLGGQILDEANRLGVTRGVTVEGIGPGSNPRYQDKLLKSIDNAALARSIAGDNKAAQGFVNFVNGSFNYTNIPAVVEDYSRLAGYINARRMGHAPEESAKLVDKALFNYMHGLNAVESRWVKKVVPFYSYQRFALPFVMDVLAHTPGRVTNVAKTMDGFFRAWNAVNSNDRLTDTERRVLPGWLMEQPQAFKGFNEQMKAVFNSFNNFTPLDVMNLLPSGDDGITETSMSDYTRKVGMAQLAPWIKIPVELMMEKDTFTGQALEANGLRKLGPMDSHTAAGWLTAGMTATLTQDARFAALAGTLGYAGGKMSPQTEQAMLGFLMGWEEGIDPDTGIKTTFVSPYRFHVATSVFPALNDALKMARTDRSAGAKAMQTIFGIGTTEIDLGQEQDRRFKEHDKAVQKKDREIDDAEERGLHMRAAKSQQDLAELLKRIAAEEQYMGGNVRGGTQ